MALSVLVQLAQGLTIGTPGNAIIGVVTTPVTALAVLSGSGSVLAYRWTWVDVPPGSSIPVGVIAEGSLPSISFAPDHIGDFLLKLEVLGAGGGTVASNTVAFRILRTSGRAIPAFMGDASSMKFSGQTRGWAPDMEAWLAYLDGLSSGFPILDLTFGAIVQTAAGVWTRYGARKIDMSQFSASSVKIYATFENTVDSNVWSSQVRLFDITHNVLVAGSLLDNVSVSPGRDVAAEFSATLTMGTVSGDIRTDVATIYEVQFQTNGTISDQNAQRAVLSSARLVFSK